MEKFTSKQKILIKMVCDGKSNREIGEKLGITTPSAAQFVHRTLLKIGLKTRYQLIANQKNYLSK